ncbi:hypothetical protein NQ534_17030 [Marvinbryantia formatexigens DSM 14469]|nr:hypothetical protein [Marvinbryantia formatexigens]UWO24114.1 hypothetical protein NQ534_17030 [Marvinbryantia formatexigens DSM 14469]
MISENIKHPKITGALAGVLVFALLLLIYHEPLGNLVLWTMKGIAWIRIAKMWLHLILYLAVMAAVAALCGMGLYRLLPRLQLMRISLKAEQAELDLEKQACTDYLDLYSMELVYCLERIADQIDRTVIFEDIDRFQPEKCIEIFTRLREINYLVNLRLDKQNYIRFVFVINDDVVSGMEHAKFFDYILPVIPSINKKTSEIIFTDNLRKVNKSIAGFLKNIGQEHCAEHLSRLDQYDTTGIVHCIAPYIKDFRLQYAILNDYGLMAEQYFLNNSRGAERDDAEQILAFAVYKNIWPEDYRKFWQGENNILFEEVKNEGKDDKDKRKKDEFSGLRDILVGGENPFLNIRSLYYVGFSEDNMIERHGNIWYGEYEITEKIRLIEEIQKEDRRIIDELREFCASEKLTDSGDERQILVSAIRCMLRCEVKETKWFFAKRDIIMCLEVLSELEETEYITFLSWAKEEAWAKDADRDGIFNVYKCCCDMENLIYRQDLSMKMVDVFCQGVNDEERYSNKILHVEGNRVDLGEKISKTHKC